MDTISIILALCAWNFWTLVDSSHNKPAIKSFDIVFVARWIHCWTNSWVVHDLRCHDVHITSLQWFFSIYFKDQCECHIMLHIQTSEFIIQDTWSFWLLVAHRIGLMTPNHYLDQWWLTKGILRNNLQWNLIKTQKFSQNKIPWKCCLQNGGHFF